MNSWSNDKSDRADEIREDAASIHVGLCADCRHHRVIRSDRGATFHLCNYSYSDDAFPKYPRLPVIECAAYQRLGT